jgi:hypothetical protein
MSCTGARRVLLTAVLPHWHIDHQWLIELQYWCASAPHSANTQSVIDDWLITGVPPVPAQCSSQLRLPLVDWLIEYRSSTGASQVLLTAATPHSHTERCWRTQGENWCQAHLPKPTILALLLTLQLSQVPCSPYSLHCNSTRYHNHPTPHPAALPGT